MFPLGSIRVLKIATFGLTRCVDSRPWHSQEQIDIYSISDFFLAWLAWFNHHAEKEGREHKKLERKNGMHFTHWFSRRPVTGDGGCRFFLKWRSWLSQSEMINGFFLFRSHFLVLPLLPFPSSNTPTFSFVTFERRIFSLKFVSHAHKNTKFIHFYLRHSPPSDSVDYL